MRVLEDEGGGVRVLIKVRCERPAKRASAPRATT